MRCHCSSVGTPGSGSPSRHVGEDTLVKVMDVVRGGHQLQDGKAVHVDYFPNISIGDAPIVHAVVAKP